MGWVVQTRTMKSKNKELLGELVGIMIGDGCLSRAGGKYIVYISGHKFSDLKYHSTITKKLFRLIFHKKVHINFKKNENSLFIRFSDKTIFYRLSSFGIPIGVKYLDLKIPELISDDAYFRAFVRGLFDTDGCIILSKQHRKIAYYPRIEITSKSETFLLEIIARLKLLGFFGSVSNKGGSYRLELPGVKNLCNWVATIGSSHPIKRGKLLEINSKLL